jgi:hypothetical protein
VADKKAFKLIEILALGKRLVCCFLLFGVCIFLLCISFDLRRWQGLKGCACNQAGRTTTTPTT